MLPKCLQGSDLAKMYILLGILGGILVFFRFCQHQDVCKVYSFGRIWWPLERPSFVVLLRNFLSSLSTDTAGQLDVLGHDGDTLGVDGAQVGIFKETNQVSLRSLLESHDGRGLESQVSLEVLGDLTDQTLEGQLADEQLGGLLVTTDLTESDCSGPVTMGLLDSSGGWGALTGSLGSQLFPGGLASGGLTSGLFCSGHFAAMYVL